MLRKSIRHEFRATARVVLPVYLAILSLSVVAHFTLHVLSSGGYYGTLLRTISGVVTGVFFACVAASGIGVIALTVERFYRSFLSDEGYLTMTLPVSTHKLISAKLLASVVWYALSGVVIAAAILIALLDSGDWSGFFMGIADFSEAVWETLQTAKPGVVAGLIACGIELFLCMILGAALTSLLIYAAMAIGYSLNRHKKLMSVVFSFVFYHATQIAAAYCGINIVGEIIAKYERAYAAGVDWGVMTGIAVLSAVLLLLLAACALYYFITHWFLTKKLNLE